MKSCFRWSEEVGDNPFSHQNPSPGPEFGCKYKGHKPASSPSSDCSFIKQRIYTHLLCLITAWSLDMNFLKKKIKSILRKHLKRLLEQQTWLWRWVTECRICVPVSRATGNFGARKNQYHSGKVKEPVCFDSRCLLSTFCALESVGTGWKAKKLERRIGKKRKITIFKPQYCLLQRDRLVEKSNEWIKPPC